MEGDYTSPEALPGVTVFGSADPPLRPRDLQERCVTRTGASWSICRTQATRRSWTIYVRCCHRWIAEVFGDYPLANDVQALENQYCADGLGDVAGRLTELIRSRYEFIDPCGELGGV
ncbi:MAG TPA: hypothetical protein VH601_14715 [Bryobacteraceae bacterium]